MDKSLQTRVINFKYLCSHNLINDIKEAATCDVRTVCRFVCHRCPCAPESIDLDKIKITGLSSYTIQLNKTQDGQLLIAITMLGIDNWMIMNNLPFTTLNI